MTNTKQDASSTEALRSALAEGRRAAVELASRERERGRHFAEIQWCKVVDKIDAALSASPEKFHNVCCNKCGYVGPATSAMGQHPDCNYIGSRVAAGSPAPSTEVLREWRDIKTAPRDGTEIIGLIKWPYEKAAQRRIIYWSHPGNCVIAAYMNTWMCAVTTLSQREDYIQGWMPLPPAPDAARTALAGVTAPETNGD